MLLVKIATFEPSYHRRISKHNIYFVSHSIAEVIFIGKRETVIALFLVLCVLIRSFCLMDVVASPFFSHSL